MKRRILFAGTMHLLTMLLLTAGLTSAQTRRDVGNTRSPGTRESSPPASSPRDDGRNSRPAPAPAPAPQPSPSSPAPEFIPHAAGGVVVDAPIPPTMPVPGPASDAYRDLATAIREVELSNRLEFPSFSGYDFSGEDIVSFSDEDMDIYFESAGDEQRLNVSTDTDIQDLGPASSVRENLRADQSEWSLTHSSTVEPGHQYLVWLWDGSTGRVFVKDAWDGGILMDWLPGPAIPRRDSRGPLFPQ
jgi:hypothetical protein